MAPQPTKHELNEPAESPSKKFKTNEPSKDEMRQRKEQERLQLKEQREKERLQEKERKEQQKLAERERKERERVAERERKEKERLQQKEQREKERQLEKERREQERQLEKERREREKQADKEKKLAEKNKQSPNQKRIAFAVQKKVQPVDIVITDNDYEEYFLPFNVKENVTMYRNIHKEDKQDALSWLRSRAVRRGGLCQHSTKSVVETLSEPGNITETQARNLLGQLPLKYLQFAEDVRPPYVGTFSKQDPFLLGTDPFQMVPEVNYLVDSEAEWEEIDEGEDLDSGEEEEDDEFDDEDDMSGFLDPEESQIAGPLMGELVPVIKWGDIKTTSFRSLIPDRQHEVISISDNYWTVVNADGVVVSAPTLHKKPTLVPDDILPALMQKISGSDMNKTLLVELMHREFPGVAKAAINTTIGACAQRVRSEKDTVKRWRVNQDIAAKFNLTTE